MCLPIFFLKKKYKFIQNAHGLWWESRRSYQNFPLGVSVSPITLKWWAQRQKKKWKFDCSPSPEWGLMRHAEHCQDMYIHFKHVNILFSCQYTTNAVTCPFRADQYLGNCLLRGRSPGLRNKWTCHFWLVVQAHFSAQVHQLNLSFAKDVKNRNVSCQ